MSMLEQHYLTTLFEPKSLAVIGASEREDSVGQILFKNILESGYKGPLYPINPKHETVQGIEAHRSIEAVAEGDLTRTANYTSQDEIGDLIANHYTPVTENAAIHIEFDLIANVDWLKCSPLLNGTCFLNTVDIREVLKVAFPCLITDGTVERMIHQQKFGDCLTAIHSFRGGDILHNHSILHHCPARSNKFWHRAGILCRALRYFYQTGPALASAPFEL